MEVNLKKCCTLKFMTNISCVPSICIHRSITLIFIEKTVCLSIFSHGKFIFSAILDFHFCENPRFRDKFQALNHDNNNNNTNNNNNDFISIALFHVRHAQLR